MVRAKMMKSARKIFFKRGLYNRFGTPVGASRDLLNSFDEILFIFFRFLVSIFFAIFRAKIIKCGREIFFTRGIYNGPGTFVRPPQALLDSFLLNYLLTFFDF